MSPQFDQGLQDALDAPDPGLEPDEFTQAVHDSLQSDVETPEEPEAAEPVPSTDEAEIAEEVDAEGSAPPEDATPPPPTTLEIGGVQIPADKAEAVANFYAWSQTPEGQPWVRYLSEAMDKGIDPRTLGLPQDGVVTRPPPPPPPEPEVQEPEYFDPETSYKTLHQRVDEMASILQAQQQAAEALRQQQSQAILTSVRDEFAQSHELSPQESQQLIDHMNRTTVLEGYKVVTPTGEVDTRATLLAAMEAAMYAVPDLKEKEIARIQNEQKDRGKKDRKLAAVGGTSGSVPHRPQPVTQEERDAEAVEIIANAMGVKA